MRVVREPAGSRCGPLAATSIGRGRKYQTAAICSTVSDTDLPARDKWLSDAGYELFYFQADESAFVVMDIMTAIEAYCLGIHLTGKLHAVINPAGRYLFAVGDEHQHRTTYGASGLDCTDVLNQ